MNTRGWLLDAYIEDKNAVQWIKTSNNETMRLVERHRPTFTAKPITGFHPEDLEWLFEQHPQVYATKTIERYPDLNRDKKVEAVEITVDHPNDLQTIITYAEQLREVDQVYNTGLTQIQWYLIHYDTPPTSQCTINHQKDRVKTITRLDDENRLEPPPFTTLTLNTNKPLKKATLTHNNQKTIIKGTPQHILTELVEHIHRINPDIIATNQPKTTLQTLKQTAQKHDTSLNIGRGNLPVKGRVHVSTHSLHTMGVAGLSERSRFTYAPMDISHSWTAGKTIDSRQCAEATKQDIMIPPMKGGISYNAWAWDLIRHDKGGMVYSPKPGLHVNVAALDFESMFPNIIVKKNVSYETVTENGVREDTQGFLGQITEPFLNRRLRFKHLRNQYPVNSPEYQWCQQRQTTLKLFLVVYYGYSGCYANRFANTRVFQEINRQARDAMVTALNTAQRHDYEVVYGPYDSLFVKHPEADKKDYQNLAEEITDTTGLPMGLDHHFQYLVLLNKATDPNLMATNHYYGKQVDNTMFYRGIEVRRHDTPPYIHRVQEQMIKTLLQPNEPENVLTDGLRQAQGIAREAIHELKQGHVDPRELVISKRLRRSLDDYTSKQPHIVAALLGDMEEMSRYILVNTQHNNPYLRVMPETMIDKNHRAYDRRKYAAMMKRAAWNILRPFIPDETKIGQNIRETSLKEYLV
jgi:DNA polymerase elongation subunit (family B)